MHSYKDTVSPRGALFIQVPSGKGLPSVSCHFDAFLALIGVSRFPSNLIPGTGYNIPSNSNWTEWSTIQEVIGQLISTLLHEMFVYFAILYLAYFATLKFRDFSKILYFKSL